MGKVISMEMWRGRKKMEMELAELRQMYEYMVAEKRTSGKVLQFRARECGENV